MLDFPVAVTPNELALAGILSGAAVGVVTPTMNWLISRANRKHERQLAADERRFAPKAETYEQMLRFVGTMMLRIDRTLPMLGPLPAPPPPPGDDEEIALRAKFATYASPEAVDLLDNFYEAARDFFIMAGIHQRDKKSGAPGQTDFKEVHEKRKACRALFREFESLLREELAAV